MVLHYLKDKKPDINVQKEGRNNSPGHDKNIYSPDKILHYNIYSFATQFYIISLQINMAYVLLFTHFFFLWFYVKRTIFTIFHIDKYLYRVSRVFLKMRFQLS